MKTIQTFYFLIILCMIVNLATTDAQIIYYHQYFDEINGVLPTGCSAIDGDGGIPSDPSYSTTWATKIVGNDTIVASTSSYMPADTANDWLILHNVPVPAGAVTELRWKARSSNPNTRDGYQVYISPNGSTVNNFLMDSLIFSDSMASPIFVEESVDISNFFGQVVNIAFRNNSYDKEALYIDDIYAIALPAFDISAFEAAPLFPAYTQMPINQLSSPPTLTLIGIARNNGGLTTDDVSMQINLYLDTFATPIFTASGFRDSILMSDTAQFMLGTYTPLSLAQATYTAEYIVHMNTTDAIPANDTLYQTFSITDSVWARDNGVVQENLSGTAGQSSVLGQNFEVNSPTGLAMVSFYIDNNSNQLTGQAVYAAVYDVTGNQPSNLIAVSDTLIVSQTGGQWLTIPVHNGPIALSSGNYFIAVAQQDSAIMLGASSHIFTPNTAWQGSNGSWNLNETLGYNLSYLLRMHLTNSPIITNTKDIKEAALMLKVSPNPVQDWLTIQGNIPLKKSTQYTILDILGNCIQSGQLNWSSSNTTLNLANLPTGIYFIKIDIDDQIITTKIIKN